MLVNFPANDGAVLQTNIWKFKIFICGFVCKTSFLFSNLIGNLFYSQSRSRVNSNSKNEMNIRISLCNVRRVNEMLDISLEIVSKKTH